MRKCLLILLAVLTLLTSACATGNKLEREQRQIRLAQRIEQGIKERDFSISILRMKALYGQPMQVSYGYDLTVRGDTVISNLPYVGEVYRVPYGGGKGLVFTGMMSSYDVTYHPNGQLAHIAFQVTTDEDTFEYRIDLYNNGKAMIDVYAIQRNSISFDGEFEFKDGTGY